MTPAALPLRPGLVRLALVRALPPRVLVLLVVVGVLAALQDWELPPDVLDRERLARGFVRQGVWTLLVFLIAPLLVHRAAHTFREWREAEADWLAPRPAGGAGLLLSSFVGLWLAALLAFGFTAVLAEGAVGEAGPTHRLWERGTNPTALLFEGDEPARWVQRGIDLAALPPHALVRVELTVAPGSGPAVSARVTAASSAEPTDVTAHSTRARIFGRRALEVPAPTSGPGQLHLEVARESEGAVLVLPSDSVEILAPVSSDRRLAGELLVRLLFASVAWIALGLGLGAWMRPALASSLVLALWMVPWWWGIGAAWLPGGDLPEVWSLLGQGLAPPLPDLAAIAGTLGTLLVGFAIAGPGLSRGRMVG